MIILDDYRLKLVDIGAKWASIGVLMNSLKLQKLGKSGERKRKWKR